MLFDPAIEISNLRRRVEELERVIAYLVDQDGGIEYTPYEEPWRAGNGWE